jgi:glycosyltransferase involved in cell wall biosynthesis
VGRLEQRKGVQVVLEALAELPATVELDLHGSGPHETELRRIVDARGLNDRVHFHGFCDHEKLPDIYRRFDTLVVPSQTTGTWVEQFGRVAVEAMAAGVPVIASNSGSLPEVIADAGIIVPEADVPSWAEAIRSLAESPDDARRLSVAGVSRARAFTWSAVAAEHGTLYERVVR